MNRQLRPGNSQHRSCNSCAAGHIRLHVLHVGFRFQVHPTCIVYDSLSNQDNGSFVFWPGGFVLHDDEDRWLMTPFVNAK